MFVLLLNNSAITQLLELCKSEVTCRQFWTGSFTWKYFAVFSLGKRIRISTNIFHNLFHFVLIVPDFYTESRYKNLIKSVDCKGSPNKALKKSVNILILL